MQQAHQHPNFLAKENKWSTKIILGLVASVDLSGVIGLLPNRGRVVYKCRQIDFTIELSIFISRSSILRMIG